VRFRERINANLVNQINQRMVQKSQEASEEKLKKKLCIRKGRNKRAPQSRKLILDATCAPGDISYPNDLRLLNQARVKIEKIRDTLYEPLKGKLGKKPKTYRNLARKNYLQVAKKRRPSRKETRKAIRKQLQYVKRNLSHIDQLIQAGDGLEALSSTQYKSLLVVAEVYRQQQWMYDNKTSRIEDRIVSLSQPHIRQL
jgi:hypothetical protein